MKHRRKTNPNPDLNEHEEQEMPSAATTAVVALPPDTEEQEGQGYDHLMRVAEGLVNLQSWSQKIRFLHAEGFTNGEISKILTELRGKLLRPQHVNNVLSKPLKRPNTDLAGQPGRPPVPLSGSAATILQLARKQLQSQPQTQQPQEQERQEDREELGETG